MAKLYIVGAGPGAPDLITVRGLRLLQEADVVMYTDSLVSEELVSQANRQAEIVKSAGMALGEMVNFMVMRVREGKKLVRLHTGDPAMYGAIMEQMAMLKLEGITCEVVPGVSSVFAAAAAIGTELTVPDLTQTLILTRVEGRTPVPERERLRELAVHHCTIAIFLSATLAKKVTTELLDAGWLEDTPVAVVQRASWPDQRVIRTTVGRLAEAMNEYNIRSQAMILAGWALDPTIYEQDEFRSKLYDRQFTHGFRQGLEP